MQNEINYISAESGGIKMHYGEGRGSKGQFKDFVFGTTPEVLAKHMNEIGVADTVYGSSSMDFASEYGFENDDDAQLLWEKALVLV
jgi:hypothetical protein